MRALAPLRVVGAALLWGAAGRAAAAPQDSWEARLRELQIAAGERHLLISDWCRDRGLTAQSAAELLLAVELSGGSHPGVNATHGYMRRLDDAFWKKNAPQPGKGALDAYERKARKARDDDRKERLKLAEWAAKHGRPEEARLCYEQILREHDGALQFDEQGRLLVGGDPLPAEFSARVREETVLIDERPYRRDGFLSSLPRLDAVFEAGGEHLVAWSQASAGEAQEALRLGEALHALLEREMGGRPQRRLGLFLFTRRAEYQPWLESVGFSAYAGMDGLADAQSAAAVVCTEGLTPEQVQGLILHELTHLFSMGVTRAVMPSWYQEGVAERHGGAGAFLWDGAILETGGVLADSRLQELREPARRFSLDQLLDGDAAAIFARDPARGRLYYAQSWALVRYLRDGGAEGSRRKFAQWEAACRGAAVGAEAGNLRAADAAPARELFRRVFAEDLVELAEGFGQYLDRL